MSKGRVPEGVGGPPHHVSAAPGCTLLIPTNFLSHEETFWLITKRSSLPDRQMAGECEKPIYLTSTTRGTSPGGTLPRGTPAARSHAGRQAAAAPRGAWSPLAPPRPRLGGGGGAGEPAVPQVVPAGGRVISPGQRSGRRKSRVPPGGRREKQGRAAGSYPAGAGEEGSGAPWCRRQTPKEAVLVCPPPAAFASARGGTPPASARPPLPSSSSAGPFRDGRRGMASA